MLYRRYNIYKIMTQENNLIDVNHYPQNTYYKNEYYKTSETKTNQLNSNQTKVCR